MSIWNEYPRPQLVRDSFFCLNGKWQFGITEQTEELITVPFVPQSRLSGVQRQFPQKLPIYYKREFTLPEGFIKSRVLLHFDAVDQIAEVSLNGVFLGKHEGGYDRFTFDITDHLQQNNTLFVKVTDDLDNHILPYGKQREKRGGMWYTAVSGVWQTVWIESVPEKYIQKIKIIPDLTFADIEIFPKLDAKLILDDTEYEFVNGVCRVTPDKVCNWTPEDPFLYDFKIVTEDDEIASYFALRKIEIKEVSSSARICLNGKPYFFHGVLDQGYFLDGIFTPSSPQMYKNDILCMKKLGINTLRKHIKIEPDLFYSYCDRLGMIVFQDMVNNGKYSFIRDTALPTIGLKKRNDKRMHKNAVTRQALEGSMLSTVDGLFNFPCICLWTVFNEGWGQFNGTRMYKLLKQKDPTRVVDTVSGWFKGPLSDVESEHVYFKAYKHKKSSKPTLLSEFGGYTLKIEGHGFKTDKAYGYKPFKNIDDYNDALLKMYERDVIPFIKDGLCADIYTQLSDVEDEINGLVTYDRQIVKADVKMMQYVADKIEKEIEEIK